MLSQDGHQKYLRFQFLFNLTRFLGHFLVLASSRGEKFGIIVFTRPFVPIHQYQSI